jgi:8-oxo-dGTP pyrophosphatase MutT (NUDIX family)
MAFGRRKAMSSLRSHSFPVPSDQARYARGHTVFSIGGAIDPGETLVDAAVREMREETGIVIQPTELGEPMAQEEAEFDRGSWRLVQDQTYFALALTHDPSAITFDGLEPLERTSIDAAAWWTPDDLEADGTAASARLPEIMRDAVRTVRGEG